MHPRIGTDKMVPRTCALLQSKTTGGEETAVSSKSSAGLLSLERSRTVNAQPTSKRTTDKALNRELMSRSANYGKNKRIYAPKAPAEMETNERQR